jgi:hypothetical protein
MALRVVGAGVGRTGTNSLQVALERLLGSPCYHMMELVSQPRHVEAWHQAVQGTLPDWNQLLAGYEAAVDWPVSGFWRELCAANPDAVVVLSVRASPEVWWKSASQTILHVTERQPPPEMEAWFAMYLDFLRARFTDRWNDPEAAMAAYVRHNDAVRAGVPRRRLVDWEPGDGWEPICAALGLPIPDEPFPHLNTTAEFRVRAGWDAAGPVPS